MIHDNNYEKSQVSSELERLVKNIKLRSTDIKNKNRNDICSRNIDWICRVPDESFQNSEKNIVVVVESHGDEIRFEDFIQQLDELVCEMSDQYSGIIDCHELWEGIHCITVALERDKMSELMMQMAFIPEVEKVEEGMHFGGKPEFGEGIVGVSPYPMNSRSDTRMRVVLKEDILLGY